MTIRAYLIGYRSESDFSHEERVRMIASCDLCIRTDNSLPIGTRLDLPDYGWCSVVKWELHGKIVHFRKEVSA